MNGLKGECNYTTAMDSASSFISETKLQKVKKLIAAIDEYLKIRSQDSSVLISRYLQVCMFKRINFDFISSIACLLNFE